MRRLPFLISCCLWFLLQASLRADLPQSGQLQPLTPLSLPELEARAKTGDAEAAHQLGDRYAKGSKGAPKDEAKAIVWYRLAAEHGQREAKADLADYLLNGKGGLAPDPQQAFKWYLEAAQAGHAFACHMVAWMCELGKGTPSDLFSAAAWYRKAGELGEADAWAELGRMAEYGRGVPKDENAAAQYFAVAAREGSALGMMNLGWFMVKGKGGLAPNPVAARRLFEVASVLGNARAEGNLGYLYENGLGVTANLSTAMIKFVQSADAGDLLSQRHVAELCGPMGKAATDLPKALHYLTLAAMQGDRGDILRITSALTWPASFATKDASNLRAYLQTRLRDLPVAGIPLGVMCLLGVGGPVDEPEGDRLLLAAAETGEEAKGFLWLSQRMQFSPGTRWHRPHLAKALLATLSKHNVPGTATLQARWLLNGTPAEMAEGAHLLRGLADQGDPRAIFELGLLYQNGRSVPRSAAKAMDAFRKAASLGEPEAMYHLGVLHQTGILTKKDFKAAAKWYQQAEAKGWEPAKGRVKPDGTLVPLVP